MIKMSLVWCYECGEKMSDHAEACPHCGYTGRYHGGFCDPKEEKEDKELTERLERERREGARLAAEKERKRKELETQKEWEENKRITTAVGAVAMSIILFGLVVDIVFGIRYVALEIWASISALF